MPVSFRAAQAHLTTGLDPGEGLPGTLRPHRLSAAASADRRLEKPARNRRERQRIGKRVDTGRHHAPRTPLSPLHRPHAVQPGDQVTIPSFPPPAAEPASRARLAGDAGQRHVLPCPLRLTASGQTQTAADSARWLVRSLQTGCHTSCSHCGCLPRALARAAMHAPAPHRRPPW